MSRSFVSMEVFLQTSRLWTRFAPLNATRRFHTRGHSVILCGLTQKMWTPGPSVHEVQAGCLVPKSQMRYTLLTYQWTVHKNAICILVRMLCSCVLLVCSHQQLEAHLPRASAGAWRLQVYVWREAGDCVVGTQLLLPVWKHCIHHGLQGCQQTRAQTFSCCSRLWACHTAQDNHPLLSLITVSCSSCEGQTSEMYLNAKCLRNWRE